MTDPQAVARAVALLRACFAARDRDGVARGIEALRALDPDHADVHLATAFLREAEGRTAEAAAARIRGYARAATLTGDPAARALLNGALSQALAGAGGYGMLRPLALVSSDPAVLEAFVTAACNHGCFDEAEATLRKLRAVTGLPYPDADDAIRLGQGIDALLIFAPDGVAVHRPIAWVPLHHSVVTQAVVGAAVRRGRLTRSFARPLRDALMICGVLTDAAVMGALRLLLAHEAEDCVEAFLDLAGERLSASNMVAILDDALASAVGNDRIEAARCYGRRFDRATGCATASLTRLSSHLGVRARKRPSWAGLLETLHPGRADEAALATAHPFPAAGLADGTDGRIDVFLKCVKRPFDIHPFVAFWMECFNDPSRYRIRLLDDTGLDLASHYGRYPIATSGSLRVGPNEARALFTGGRRPLNLLGWESVANLTPFAETGTRWFWNIDADDIRPLVDARTTVDHVRGKLRAVEDFAADAGLMAMSYDLWASAHYLFDHGYHWTFGISLCRSDPALLGRMLGALAGCDIPAFRINLDHLFSRLSDGSLAEGRYARHFASFIFDRPQVLQKDVDGNEIHHNYAYLKKRLSFDAGMSSYVQNGLHPKTLVV